MPSNYATRQRNLRLRHEAQLRKRLREYHDSSSSTDYGSDDEQERLRRIFKLHKRAKLLKARDQGEQARAPNLPSADCCSDSDVDFGATGNASDAPIGSDVGSSDIGGIWGELPEVLPAQDAAVADQPLVQNSQDAVADQALVQSSDNEAPDEHIAAFSDEAHSDSEVARNDEHANGEVEQEDEVNTDTETNVPPLHADQQDHSEVPADEQASPVMYGPEDLSLSKQMRLFGQELVHAFCQHDMSIEGADHINEIYANNMPMLIRFTEEKQRRIPHFTSHRATCIKKLPPIIISTAHRRLDVPPANILIETTTNLRVYPQKFSDRKKYKRLWLECKVQVLLYICLLAVINVAWVRNW